MSRRELDRVLAQLGRPSPPDQGDRQLAHMPTGVEAGLRGRGARSALERDWLLEALLAKVGQRTEPQGRARGCQTEQAAAQLEGQLGRLRVAEAAARAGQAEAEQRLAASELAAERLREQLTEALQGGTQHGQDPALRVELSVVAAERDGLRETAAREAARRAEAVGRVLELESQLAEAGEALAAEERRGEQSQQAVHALEAELAAVKRLEQEHEQASRHRSRRGSRASVEPRRSRRASRVSLSGLEAAPVGGAPVGQLHEPENGRANPQTEAETVAAAVAAFAGADSKPAASGGLQRLVLLQQQLEQQQQLLLEEGEALEAARNLLGAEQDRVEELEEQLEEAEDEIAELSQAGAALEELQGEVGSLQDDLETQADTSRGHAIETQNVVKRLHACEQEQNRLEWKVESLEREKHDLELMVEMDYGKEAVQKRKAALKLIGRRARRYVLRRRLKLMMADLNEFKRIPDTKAQVVAATASFVGKQQEALSTLLELYVRPTEAALAGWPADLDLPAGRQSLPVFKELFLEPFGQSLATVTRLLKSMLNGLYTAMHLSQRESSGSREELDQAIVDFNRVALSSEMIDAAADFFKRGNDIQDAVRDAGWARRRDPELCKQLEHGDKGMIKLNKTLQGVLNMPMSLAATFKSLLKDYIKYSKSENAELKYLQEQESLRLIQQNYADFGKVRRIYDSIEMEGAPLNSWQLRMARVLLGEKHSWHVGLTLGMHATSVEKAYQARRKQAGSPMVTSFLRAELLEGHVLLAEAVEHDQKDGFQFRQLIPQPSNNWFSARYRVGLVLFGAGSRLMGLVVRGLNMGQFLEQLTSAQKLALYNTITNTSPASSCPAPCCADKTTSLSRKGCIDGSMIQTTQPSSPTILDHELSNYLRPVLKQWGASAVPPELQQLLNGVPCFDQEYLIQVETDQAKQFENDIRRALPGLEVCDYEAAVKSGLLKLSKKNKASSSSGAKPEAKLSESAKWKLKRQKELEEARRIKASLLGT